MTRQFRREKRDKNVHILGKIRQCVGEWKLTSLLFLKFVGTCTGGRIGWSIFV